MYPSLLGRLIICDWKWTPRCFLFVVHAVRFLCVIRYHNLKQLKYQAMQKRRKDFDIFPLAIVGNLAGQNLCRMQAIQQAYNCKDILVYDYNVCKISFIVTESVYCTNRKWRPLVPLFFHLEFRLFWAASTLASWKSLAMTALAANGDVWQSHWENAVHKIYFYFPFSTFLLFSLPFTICCPFPFCSTSS